MPGNVVLLTVSIVLQLAVIGFAIRQLFWMRRAAVPWALVATAFTLMLMRRILAFAAFIDPKHFHTLSPIAGEWVAISISALLFVAMVTLHPMLVRGWAAEQALKAQVEQQKRQAVALQEAIQARDTFLSVASHELKTPLTPMTLKLQALARSAQVQPGGGFVDEVKGFIDTSTRQVRNLTSLVNDLLDVARIEGGRFQVVFEPVDLASVVREVTTRFGFEAHRAGSSLTCEIPARLFLRSDELRLDQVVTNLLDNALKYGRGKPIHVQVREQADTAVFQVTDEGIGIASENLVRIFDRFERAVSERNYGGLGLGLYITKTLVEAMGGFIDVQSEPGKGATFTVELPRGLTSASA